MRAVIERMKVFALLLILALAFAGGFWFGLVPQWLSPFPKISLDERPSWFVDARLATLRFDPASCRSVLKAPQIDATPIPDVPIKNGCGIVNSVRFSKAGGASLGVNKITCEMAAATALWIAYEVQPAAMKAFGKRVVGIGNMGTYDCRNIIGSKLFAKRRSQHATANALDIGSFTLEGGDRVSVLKHWKGNSTKSRFLQDIHARACPYFRVAIGPEYNKAHRNHFHFDRGLGWICK